MTQTDGLKKLFFSGVLWNAVGNMGAQGIQFITTLVLARLLIPEEFGVVAMATSFTLLAGVVNQLGISPSIVQKKDITESHLTSAFWANILMGIILCLITIGVSDFIADFFNNRKVQPVLCVLSFTFFIGAVKIVNTALLVKELQYRKLSYIVLAEMASNGILAIILAFLDFGVWSIVAGRLVGIFIGVVVTFCLNKWRPSFYFDIIAFKELFSFGIQVMCSSFLSYFITTLDNIIVGRYLGAVALGVYSIAYNIVTLPQKKISSIVTGVAFPAFSRIQDDRERILYGYIKILNMLSFVIFPILGGLFSIAPEFILFVLGERWSGAIIPLKILCFVGVLKSVGSTVGSIFLSQGRPDIELKLDMLYTIILFGALMTGKKWGLPGISYALCIVGFLMQIIIFYSVSHLIKCRLITIYRPIIRNFIMMMGMIIMVLQFKMFIASFGLDTIMILILSVIFGVIMYVLIAFIGNKETLKELLKITGCTTQLQKIKSIMMST